LWRVGQICFIWSYRISVSNKQKDNKLSKNDKHDKTAHEQEDHPEESGAREYWEWEDVWLVNDGAKVKRETKNWILQNNKKPTKCLLQFMLLCYSCYTSFVC